MKKLLTLLFALQAFCSYAQTLPFAKTETGADTNALQIRAETADGGYLLAGTIMQKGIAYPVLARCDSNMTIQWAKQFNQAASLPARSVVQTSSGDILVLFKNCDNLSTKSRDVLVKLDANGTIKWTKAYQLYTNCSPYLQGSTIMEAANKQYILVGTSDPSYNRDIKLTFLDTAGAILSSNLVSAQAAGLNGIVLNVPGGLFIAGNDNTGGPAINAFQYIYCNAAGNVINGRVCRITNGDITISKAYIASDGSIYCILSNYLNSNYTSMLCRINKAGMVSWLKTAVISGSRVSMYEGAPGTRGNLYLAANVGNSAKSVTAFMEIDSLGNIVWEKAQRPAIVATGFCYDAASNTAAMSSVPLMTGTAKTNLHRTRMDATLGCTETVYDSVKLQTDTFTSNVSKTYVNGIATTTGYAPPGVALTQLTTTDSFVCNSTGIAHISHKAIDFEIYPNPVQAYGSFTIKANTAGNSEVYIYDMSGKPVYVQALDTATIAQLNIGLATGMYIVRLVNGDNTYVKKLLVQ